MPRVFHEWDASAQTMKPADVAQFPMFAFGSNLDVGQLMFRAPNARFIGTAHLNHALLWFVGTTRKTGHGVATVRQTKNHDAYVPGLLVKMTPKDVEEMDRYEGVATGAYRRVLVMVVKPSGKPVQAFTYVHTKTHTNRPHQDYVTRITSGYRFFGFDLDVLRAAVKRSPETTPPPKTTKDKGDIVTDMHYVARSDGRYQGVPVYGTPQGRPRSTPPKYAQPIGRDGKPRQFTHSDFADGYIQPHDCDCPNYRKACRLAECPRFDNTMDDRV